MRPDIDHILRPDNETITLILRSQKKKSTVNVFNRISLICVNVFYTTTFHFVNVVV